MRLFAMGPALALGLVVLALEPLELATVYEKGVTIRTEVESTSEVKVADLEASLNGQELPRQALSGMEASLNELTTNSTTFLDTFLAVEDGAPVRLERTFEILTKVEEKEGGETEEGGHLEGRTIELTLDEDDEVSAAIADDGDEVDESYLEEYRLRFLADYVLPEDGVEVGDTWTVDEEDAKRVAGLGTGPRVFESEERESNGMDELLDAAGEVSMEATFEGIEEHDDLRCAHITFETTITAELDELPDSFINGAGEQDEMSGAVDLEVEIEGEAWFALEQQRPVELIEELSGRILVEMNMKGGPEGQKREVEIKIDADLSGTNRQRWTVEE